jgi:hypothetical protein
MKNILFLAVSFGFLCMACGKKEAQYIPAESALDAGREFIDACLKGDFAKAAFYMVNDSTNTRHLGQAESRYRENDKEGRQQLRQASINIREVSDVDDSTTIIYYNNSFDKLPLKVKIVRQDKAWLVDFKYTFSPNL